MGALVVYDITKEVRLAPSCPPACRRAAGTTRPRCPAAAWLPRRTRVAPTVTTQASFENVAKWLAELKENATADITMTIVGNKARRCTWAPPVPAYRLPPLPARRGRGSSPPPPWLSAASPPHHPRRRTWRARARCPRRRARHMPTSRRCERARERLPGVAPSGHTARRPVRSGCRAARAPVVLLRYRSWRRRRSTAGTSRPPSCRRVRRLKQIQAEGGPAHPRPLRLCKTMSTQKT